jgi:hypothetical protein
LVSQSLFRTVLDLMAAFQKARAYLSLRMVESLMLRVSLYRHHQVRRFEMVLDLMTLFQKARAYLSLRMVESLMLQV